MKTHLFHQDLHTRLVDIVCVHGEKGLTAIYITNT